MRGNANAIIENNKFPVRGDECDNHVIHKSHHIVLVGSTYEDDIETAATRI